MKKLSELVPDIFLKEVGIKETSRNQGPGIAKYWTATNYPEGYGDRAPYCAAGLCWVIREAMSSTGGTYTFVRPRTAAAFGFETWSLDQDNSTQTKKGASARADIKKGDIIIHSFSHIDVALSSPDAKGNFQTCGANTGDTSGNDGDGVYVKTRNTKTVRSRIRFLV